MISQYYWKLDGKYNVFTKIDGMKLTMHKLIMGDGIYYHKNDIKNDNRKSNLIPARGYRNNGKIKYNGYIAIYMP